MRSRTFGVAVGLALVTASVAPACSSSDEPTAGANAGTDAGAIDDDASASADGSVETGTLGPGECSVDADCDAKVPKTTPADSANGVCDALLKKCSFVAKDADGDGHAAKNCSASLGTVETGDDCDDADETTYPGAWDGPATDFDSGPGVEPDRCEATSSEPKDNDCNGSPNDSTLTVDGGKKSCACDPDNPPSCYEYASGVPIDPATLGGPNNLPMGACKKGARACAQGVPGVCVGAVGPGVEQCDDLDHDCDGKSGNQGDEVTSAETWFLDNDGDGFGDANTAPKQACVTPGAKWKKAIPNTDCNDALLTVHPGLSETCDGLDNNCSGVIDEGAKTHFCLDGDGDGYCTATCVDACVAPSKYRANCNTGIDCDDGNGSVKPGISESCNQIDDNCGGGIDEGYDLGAACTAGTAHGICHQNGTTVCKTSSTSGCTASGATAQDYFHTSASTDSSIVGYPDYNSVWDWNCDGNVTPSPNLVVSGQSYCDSPSTVCTQVKAQRGAGQCGTGPSGHYYLAMCAPTLAVCGTTAVEVWCNDDCTYSFSSASRVGCK
jgi:hypothetical protein